MNWYSPSTKEKIKEHWIAKNIPIFVETDAEDWPLWRYVGEWENLMGMSWEIIDPPEHLKEEFAWIVNHYRGENAKQT